MQFIDSIDKYKEGGGRKMKVKKKIIIISKRGTAKREPRQQEKSLSLKKIKAIELWNPSKVIRLSDLRRRKQRERMNTFRMNGGRKRKKYGIIDGLKRDRNKAKRDDVLKWMRQGKTGGKKKIQTEENHAQRGFYFHFGSFNIIFPRKNDKFS